MARIELVVAHYTESLAWLRKVPPSIGRFVYDKNPHEPFPGSIPLQNEGREAHTYLHHIVSRFETLAEVTVFARDIPSITPLIFTLPCAKSRSRQKVTTIFCG